MSAFAGHKQWQHHSVLLKHKNQLCRQMRGLHVIVPTEHASATIDDVSLASIIKGCLESEPALRTPSWQVNEQLSLLKIENAW